MRKIVCLLLSTILILGLLSGCDEEEKDTAAATQPKATTAPMERPAEETTAPEEETEALEDGTLRTTVLRSGDAELQAQYILLALSPEAPFHSEGITFNEKGTDALIRWLLRDRSREVMGDFGLESYGEAVFSLPEKPTVPMSWIPEATEDTKTIRLSVADTLDESGVLEALLEEFEETYGYEIQVNPTSATGTLAAAKLGIIDLVLTEKSASTDTFVADGYARVLMGFETAEIPLCGMEYLLCGPQDDPAGAANAESLTAAFGEIAENEAIFLSRGDDSTVHKREMALWPTGQAFGDWYLSVATEMGPLLVMNEFEGGYLLTDKLTWLIFYHNNGII